MNYSQKLLVQKISYPVFLLLIAAGVSADDKNIASSPLFLQSGVQPNIMFGFDDSGSMDWETVLPSELTDRHGGLSDSTASIDYSPNFKTRNGNSSWNNNTWRHIYYTCSGTNKMYYNPEVVYTPWKGKDVYNQPFANAGVKARNNPYFPNEGTRNLATSDWYGNKLGFFRWNDIDNDGEWDAWVDLNNNGKLDAFIDRDNDGEIDFGVDANNDGIYEVLPESELECPLLRTNNLWSRNSSYLSIGELDSWFTGWSDMSAEERQNYANWYSYYRKREYVAKRALTQIVYESIARMGFRSLHNNNSVYTAVEDVDDITLPQDNTAKRNKEDLLKNIAKGYSSGGTPLRELLGNIGQYFQGNSSPILSKDQGGECQQNFAIVMSDGTWNSGGPNVGNADGDNNSEWDGGVYQDTYKNTLADVAMHYYETDLENTYDDIVPTLTEVDENSAQHLVTYTVAFGLSGTLDDKFKDPNSDKDLDPSDIEDFAWPEPKSDQDTTIDDMRHAAYNGRGLFLSAKDPDELISSLNDSIQDVQKRTASASTVAVTSGSFNGLAMSFRSEFDSADWQGRIDGVPLEWDAATGVFTYNDSESAIVNASIVPDYDDRIIVTHDGTEGVPFRYSSLSNSQKALVGSKQLVNFIRGDSSNEAENGGTYRDRNIATGSESYLGDFIGSSPVYVADPEFLYPDTLEASAYSSYRKDPDGDGIITSLSIAGESYTLRRPPVIYVGGNDGMLHGFKVDPNPNATDFGEEIFAYVPSMVMNSFNNLSAERYYHTYTVDGTPAMGDAYFDDSWHTVLVGGLNSGGQGIYAIDVSQPQNYSTEDKAADYVLWEFSDADDANLGFTYSKPIIGKANNDKWVAIFGNGYNSAYDDRASGGLVGSGTAVLYVVDIEDGTLIKKIDTGVNQLSTSNGLSSPRAIDTNGDYIYDYVYAGDLEGNMWKFDISSENTENWKVAYESTATSATKIPLFTACSEENCDLTNRQPITAPPSIAFNAGSSKGGYIVYFGTGSYLYSEDMGDTSLQSFYAVWDRKETTLTQFDRSHLLRQEILAEQNLPYTDSDGTMHGSGNWQRAISHHPMRWYSGAGLPGTNTEDDVEHSLGWYMDLTIDGDEDGEAENEADYNLTGERIVVTAQPKDGILRFYSLIPDTDPCSSGSDGWVMCVDPNSGGYTGCIDVDLDGDIDRDDVLEYGESSRQSGGHKTDLVGGTEGQAITGLGECVYIVLPDGSERCITADGDIPTADKAKVGRRSWRELYGW